MAWKPKVLIRKKDKAGLIYHAYVISRFGVHVREGRYNSPRHAAACAMTAVVFYNNAEVDERSPFGQTVLKYEQSKPWKMTPKKKKAVPKEKSVTTKEHTMKYIVLVIISNLVYEASAIFTDKEEADKKFISVCQERLTNWDDYDADDVQAIIDQGYEKINDGSICLVNIENE